MQLTPPRTPQDDEFATLCNGLFKKGMQLIPKEDRTKVTEKHRPQAGV